MVQNKMKIYLAMGFPVVTVKDRERELLRKFSLFRRLFSFAFVNIIDIEGSIKDHIEYYKS